MTLFIVSFLAGALTVLAPCILPLLPIVIGRSTQDQNTYRPLIVSGALAVAVVVFTLLLKASTAFIDIPESTWSYISGGIIVLFGITAAFPSIWEHFPLTGSVARISNTWLGSSSQRKDTLGDICVGLSLGPIFSSCSPTYFLILATVLPQSYAKGVLYLIAYALGLSLMLVFIGYLGQRLTKKLRGVSDPRGWFKRSLGILFILVGLFVMTGTDKKVQTYVLEHGIFDVTQIEQQLLTNPMMDDVKQDMNIISTDATSKAGRYPRYKEIQEPAGFVNSEGFTLDELIGEKVVLLDFMTYSCINCQRTFPYLNAWYDKYKDDGLEIVGIHTPEFAFEKKHDNVVDAAKRFGLTFPLVLDNEYGTWNAYGNRYWPHKYLIDIDGYIVYDHIGEGEYEETEKTIQRLLEERKVRLNDAAISIDTDIAKPQETETVSRFEKRSPETYVGSLRNSTPGIEVSREGNIVTFKKPNSISPDTLYLVGTWNITGEYAEAVSKDASIIYKYRAKKVFLVMDADSPISATVLSDGKPLGEKSGRDVQDGIVTVQNEQLYRLIEGSTSETGILEIKIPSPGLRAYAFTFG